MPDNDNISIWESFVNQFKTGGSVHDLFGANGGADTGWSWFGGKDANGDPTKSALGAGLSTAAGAMNAWMGLKQLELGRDNFKMQKDQFNRNFAMQQDAYNRQIADQEKARAASSYTPMNF